MKYWIRSTISCDVLGAALRCFMAMKNIGRATEHFFCLRCCFAKINQMLDSFDHSTELARLAHAQSSLFTFYLTPKFRILWGYRAGTQESLEVLDGMLYSFDHPALSSAEQGKVRTIKCFVVLGDMLNCTCTSCT